MPYTPAARLAGGKQDAAFRTKPQIALSLVEKAQAAGIPFSAIVSDCFYGDNNALEEALLKRRLPHVLAHRGELGRGWAPAEADHSFNDAAQAVPLRAWREVIRRFRGRPHRALVGGRADPIRLWPGQAGEGHLRHDRSALAALTVHFVPDDQPARAAGGDRAAVRIAQLGRAKLQTDEGRARLADFMVRQ